MLLLHSGGVDILINSVGISGNPTPLQVIHEAMFKKIQDVCCRSTDLYNDHLCCNLSESAGGVKIASRNLCLEI